MDSLTISYMYISIDLHCSNRYSPRYRGVSVKRVLSAIKHRNI